MLRTRTSLTILSASVLVLAAAALTPGTSASATSQDDGRVVAPTGRIVALAWHSFPYVVSMLPDGSDRQRIVKFPNTSYGPIDVTGDGSKIAITLELNGPFHIYTVNSDGTDFKQVSRGGFDFAPTFSPTGARIAFTRNPSEAATLTRIKANGTDVTSLTTGEEPKAYSPSWSPDGKYIAFITSSRRSTQSIVVTDPTGTWFRFLRTFHAKRALRSLDWSPDSSKILYARTNRANTSADLWTIDADGTNITRITDTPRPWEESPVYSPDGSAIACIVTPFNPKDEGRTDVLVMDADGSNRQRIDTPKTSEGYIAWGG